MIIVRDHLSNLFCIVKQRVKSINIKDNTSFVSHLGGYISLGFLFLVFASGASNTLEQEAQGAMRWVDLITVVFLGVFSVASIISFFMPLSQRTK